MRNQQYTREELESRFRKLPPVLQDALFSVEVADSIFETGKKYGLEDWKISLLAEETGYVILGLTSPREFLSKLSEALGMNIDQVRDVAKEINHKVFFPLREELKKTHEIEMSEEAIMRGEPLVRKPPTAELSHPPTQAPPATQPPPIPLASKKALEEKTPITANGGGGAKPISKEAADEEKEKVIQIPKIPPREPLLPPELVASPKIPPINLRVPPSTAPQTSPEEPPITQKPTSWPSSLPTKPVSPPTTPVVAPPPSQKEEKISRPIHQADTSKSTAPEISPTEKKGGAERGKTYGGFDPYREPPE